MVVELMVVCVPSTCKSPRIITLPVIALLLPGSIVINDDAESVVDITLPFKRMLSTSNCSKPASVAVVSPKVRAVEPIVISLEDTAPDETVKLAVANEARPLAETVASSTAIDRVVPDIVVLTVPVPVTVNEESAKAIEPVPDSPATLRVVAMVAVPAAVNRPWASTVNVGTLEALPYEPAVTAVLSRFIVSVWPEATDDKPVPPAIVRTPPLISASPVPVSPAKSKSAAVVRSSTYFFVAAS